MTTKWGRGIKPATTLTAIIAAALFIYGFSRTRNFATGPSLSVWNDRETFVATSSIVTIGGRAERISTLLMNGAQIFTQEDGTFRQTLLLPRGYTILSLTARDRLGREITKTIRIVRTI